MRTFTRPHDLMKHKTKQLQGMRIDYHREVERIARESVQDGINLSGGRITTKQLRRMGHPYGRGTSAAASTPGGLKRGTRGKAPLLPINQQSGQLRRGWKMRSQGGPGRRSYIIYNTAKHSRYILSPWGTKKMVGRTIWGHPSKARGAPTGLMARYARARIKALHTVLRQRNKRHF